MRARVAIALVAASVVAGCAGSAPRPMGDGAARATGGDVVWGDEYEGVLLDTDPEDAHFGDGSAFAADALLGETRVTRARAAVGPLSVVVRQSDGPPVGALAWNARRAGVVVGAVRPTLAEGAVVADARASGAVEPRATPRVDGLRLAPSSSTWGSFDGAGARVSLGGLRLSAGAWRDRAHPERAAAWSSLGIAGARSAGGIAAGRTPAGASALSLYGARATGPGFVAAETGLAPDGIRGVLRGVVGPWRVLLASGAVAAAHDPLPASAARRWGAGVERRATLGRIATRTLVSSRTRRDGATVEWRQRVDWSGAAMLDGARLETGVRATRTRARVAAGLLDAPAPPDKEDEVRARVAVRTAGDRDGALRVEQLWQLDLVATGGESDLGRVALWQGRASTGHADVRLRVTAFDLGNGQLAYAGRAALPGAATFTTLSRSGVDVSASLALRLGWGVSTGVQAVRAPAGASRVVVRVGVDW